MYLYEYPTIIRYGSFVVLFSYFFNNYDLDPLILDISVRKPSYFLDYNKRRELDFPVAYFDDLCHFSTFRSVTYCLLIYNFLLYIFTYFLSKLNN